MCTKYLAIILLTPVLSVAASPVEELYEQSKELLRRGELRQAREGFQPVWKEFTSSGDPRAEVVGLYYGHLLAATGEPSSAMDVLGPIAQGTDRIALVARSSFAMCLQLLGERKRANKELRELAPLYPQENNADLAQAGRLHAELAASYTWMGKYRESAAAAREAIRLVYLAGEEYRSFRTICLIALSNAQLFLKREAEAEATLIQARENLDPLDQRRAALLEGQFGMIALRNGRTEEAERRVRTSLARLTELLGPDHYEVGAATKQLAVVLSSRDRHKEAEEMEERSRQIFERGNERPHTVSIWALQDKR